MLTYYPQIRPYATHQLKVSGGHEIYVEECGIPEGMPIVFVHGGPGGGCSEDNRRYFDPNVYRIILFDQRGSGRSTPHADIEHNTTKDLIADMEVIRKHLQIHQWILFGGSWGSTLSLLYAEKYPKHVRGMILRGIFLNRKQDVQWLYHNGANRIFPDHWEGFISHIPHAERKNLIMAYHQRLTGKDELARMSAAKAWSVWEAKCATLNPDQHLIDIMSDPVKAFAFARIGCHYFYNNCFMTANQILRNIKRIQHIPGIIVHGRYDIICSVDNAWVLHKAWPLAQLYIIRDAGHAGSELGIIDGLVHATKAMAEQLTAA